MLLFLLFVFGTLLAFKKCENFYSKQKKKKNGILISGNLTGSVFKGGKKKKRPQNFDMGHGPSRSSPCNF